jgi:hypothetical protein
MRLFANVAIAAMLLGASISVAFAAPPAARTESDVENLALEWFKRMETGEIDRTQLTSDYNAQLTDSAIQQMSRYLTKYDYGTSPTGAKVLLTRADGDQTFYVVKLIFPRGDAASLMFGFNHEGRITGVSLMSMAGD